jgi:diacylglycerol O-acyltransferase
MTPDPDQSADLHKSIDLCKSAGPHHQPDRLRGVDGLFLSLELPEQPIHIMALAILRPAEGDGATPIPVTLDDLRRHVAQRLDVLPAFRLCVKPVPFGLHHPVFVEAAEIDLGYHISRAELPAPGDRQQLGRLYASLGERCLDRRRPLWRLTLVDALDHGRQALILQIHHCLTDGAVIRTTLSRLFSSEDAQPASRDGGWRPERTASQRRLLLDAIADQGWRLARLPALVRDTMRIMTTIRNAAAGSVIAVPRPRADTPLCSLNAGFAAERRFASASLPLADVKLVKDVGGVTVNDVVLSVVAGALRDYLEQRNDLPDRPLVANVPVGLDAPGDPDRAVGNRIASLMTSLATNVADPWTRLQTISAVTHESKRRLDLLGQQIPNEWLDLIPPAIVSAIVRRSNRRRRSRPEKLHTNVTISNFRGPARTWSLGSAVVEEMYITGPPNSGVGVTFVVWDYAGTLLVGILSSADSVESPAELADGLSRSLHELVTIARCRQGESAARASGFSRDPSLVSS